MSSSLSQRRAAFAYQKLVGAGGNNKELAQSLKGLPIQMRNQGLSTALALLISRNDSTAGKMLDLIVDWLTSSGCPTKPLLSRQPDQPNPYGPNELLGWCVEADNASYRTVQAEVLALLEQAKILAAALAARDGAE